MLEGYFTDVAKSKEDAIAMNKRLIAVQAALDIIRISVRASVNTGNGTIVEACENIKMLADAIQDSLEVK
ncbi:hypothetical protein [Klebsiella sp. KE9767]|uniref:hypothetical protein n=1 Tax=Klebsiella sp. KE9767 TaxID=3118151 RepID=UPI00374FEA58